MLRPKVVVAELAELTICWKLVVVNFHSDGSNLDPVNGAAHTFLNLLRYY